MKNRRNIFKLLILIISFFSISVNALTGKYHFTSNENNNIQLEDEFTYRDDCFKRSSFLGCSHLETLSSQLAISSASWYGENVDKYEIDYSENGHNVLEMLTSMGFQKTSTNKYYTLEKEISSAGVAIGYRTITDNNKKYTLLAIVPRSAGYKQEWVGNFTVGTGDIHEGFKAARDEILRYVKKYIKDNQIEGNLKVWTVGHSRGAALANMIGGFFAGGGIEYFGNNVSITPEDVYCYTFATPTTIKDGASKNIELSVSANRTTPEYQNDTPGETFKYTKGGEVEVNDEVYRGIRNLISYNDIITMLPPKSWKFVRYGTDVSLDHEKVEEESMLEELKEISPYAYNKYINGNSPKSFERKTFDLKTLSIVKDNGAYSAMDLETFLKERINGLTYNARTNKIYTEEEYQDILASVAGIYGMTLALFDDGILDGTDGIIEPLLYSYLSYSSERLQEEGRASDETEALTLAIEELLSYFTEEEINKETFTVDDFIKIFAKYISDNENEPVADMVTLELINIVPEDYRMILDILKPFAKNTDGHEITTEEGVKAFIRACYYGTDPESQMGQFAQDGESVRAVLYQFISLGFSSDYPEITNALVDEEGNMNGKVAFKNFADVILKMLETVKDDDGNVIKTYNNISELADDKLIETVDNLFETLLEKSEELYGKDYKNSLNKHINNVKKNVTKLRRLVLYALLYEDGKYNIGNDIKNLTIFIGNMNMIPLAHYNEIYIAYAKAAEKSNCCYEEHEVEYKCTKGDNQQFSKNENTNLSFTFNIDYDVFVKEGKVFIDNKEISKDNYIASKGSTIITFKDEFSKLLSNGNHTIKVSTDEGSAEADFTISNKDTSEQNNEKVNNNISNNPDTGDRILLYLSIFLISFLGMIASCIYIKKYEITSIL